MIGIVGGGITGLVLAHELARRNLDFALFEASGEPGGVIRSRRVDGRILDLGPQRTRLTPAFERLTRELGLQDRLLVAPELPLYVYRAGRLRTVPFSLGAAARTDLFSWTEKARVLLEPLTGPPRPDESVARFLTRKFGRAAYLHMLGPLYGGLYASDPADMLMRYSLGRALRNFGLDGRSLLLGLARIARRRSAPPPACSFADGLQELPRALAAAHSQSVHLDRPVRAIRRNGDGFTLDVGDDLVAASHVVLATPAPAAARLLQPIAPEAADRLGRLRYNPLAVVHLVSDCALAGFGYQVSLVEELETRGVTFNASIFGRSGIFTAYLGGAGHPAVVEWDDERIGRIAADEFRQVTGNDAWPLLVTRVTMPAWDRSWAALDGLHLPGRVILAASYESRAGIEGRVARAREVAEAVRSKEPVRP